MKWCAKFIFAFEVKKNPNPNLEMCKEMRIHIEETRQTDRIKLIKKLCRFSSLSWTQLKYYGSLILEKKSISQAVLKIYNGYWQIVQILISTLWQLSMLHEIN